VALTTYLPRFMAVSEYRGLREELRSGSAVFLFHIVSGRAGVPDTVIPATTPDGNRRIHAREP
jgi:hypothetical protein